MTYNHPIGKDYKWYISGIFPANWGIIWYLPPIKGTIGNSIDQVGRLGGAMITFEANALEVGKGNFAARHEVRGLFDGRGPVGGGW